MSETKSQPMTVPVEKMRECIYCGSTDVRSEYPVDDQSYVAETLECRDCWLLWEIDYDVNRDVPESESPEIVSQPAVIYTEDDQ